MQVESEKKLKKRCAVSRFTSRAWPERPGLSVVVGAVAPAAAFVGSVYLLVCLLVCSGKTLYLCARRRNGGGRYVRAASGRGPVGTEEVA